MRRATMSCTVAFALIISASTVTANGADGAHRLEVRPVPGPITSMFGYRTNPMLEQSARQFHEGADMAAARGDTVCAAGLGVVTRVGNFGGYGLVVFIVHPGGLETRYAHLSEIEVSMGQLIVAGDHIAKVGSTGTATGPHLHFEVRVDGFVVDPIDELPAERPLRKYQPNV